MAEESSKPKINKKELWRSLKFVLFSISAGVIQIVTSMLLELVIFKRVIPDGAVINFIGERDKSAFIATTIGLALSILWNFTFNRMFTFKAANNVPVAMLLAFVFYVPFYPFQVWYVDTVMKALAHTGDWGFVIAQGTVMIINFVLEYLWQTFVVFRGAIDTNDIAKKQQNKDVEQNDESATVEANGEQATDTVAQTVVSDDPSQKIEVNVILTDVGKNAVAVIKIVRRVTNLDLAEVKKLVESTPATIAENKLKDEALAIADELQKVGATVELQ